MLVLTGAHQPADLLAADPTADRPISGTTCARCWHRFVRRGSRLAATTPRRSAGSSALSSPPIGITVIDAPTDLGDALDAVWAAAQLSWWAADAGRTVDGRPALDLIVPVLHAMAVG